jgi:hypothetical protein
MAGMKLSCPACGFYGSPDAFIADAEAQRALLLAFQLPASLAAPMQQYLRLFRPPQRALTSRRIETLLAELIPLITAAKIERRGRVWPAPVDAWRTALEEMINKSDRLTLPLKSHGYLLEILTGYASAAEAKTETKREQERAYPYAQDRRPADAPVSIQETLGKALPGKTPMPEAVAERLSAFGILKRKTKETLHDG